MADPAIQAAQARLVDEAVAFKDAGLYRDARTVLSTALTLALRHHFMAITGRGTRPPEAAAVRTAAAV